MNVMELAQRLTESMPVAAEKEAVISEFSMEYSVPENTSITKAFLKKNIGE
jgi:hypothetical protein